MTSLTNYVISFPIILKCTNGHGIFPKLCHPRFNEQSLPSTKTSWQQAAKTVVTSSVADLRGAQGTCAPPGSKFFKFHAVFRKFCKIVCWCPLGSWRPLLGEILDPSCNDVASVTICIFNGNRNFVFCNINLISRLHIFISVLFSSKQHLRHIFLPGKQ